MKWSLRREGIVGTSQRSDRLNEKQMSGLRDPFFRKELSKFWQGEARKPCGSKQFSRSLWSNTNPFDFLLNLLSSIIHQPFASPFNDIGRTVSDPRIPSAPCYEANNLRTKKEEDITMPPKNSLASFWGHSPTQHRSTLTLKLSTADQAGPSSLQNAPTAILAAMTMKTMKKIRMRRRNT